MLALPLYYMHGALCVAPQLRAAPRHVVQLAEAAPGYGVRVSHTIAPAYLSYVCTQSQIPRRCRSR